MHGRLKGLGQLKGSIPIAPSQVAQELPLAIRKISDPPPDAPPGDDAHPLMMDSGDAESALGMVWMKPRRATANR